MKALNTLFWSVCFGVCFCVVSAWGLCGLGGRSPLRPSRGSCGGSLGLLLSLYVCFGLPDPSSKKKASTGPRLVLATGWAGSWDEGSAANCVICCICA